MNLKRFAFYGLRRSGNHAILEWLIQNMGGSGERKVIKDRRLMQVNNAAYINEANTYGKESAFIKDWKLADSSHDYLIVSYEDVGLNHTREATKEYKKIAIIRDITNLFASRQKNYINSPSRAHRLNMRIDEYAVNLWKELATCDKNTDTVLIKFESWVESKEYRDQISKQLGLVNYDITDTMTNFGDGSSFSGKKKPTAKELATRINQVELPEEVIERINQEDIIEIRKSLGYI